MNNKIKELMSYVIIIVVVVLFRSFIATPAVVNGDSMYDTLKNHDLVIINKITLSINDINRFDIVVIKNDADNDRIIKRVIGLPNEKIEYKDNILYINDKEVKADIQFEDTEDFIFETKDNEYFVLGDNRDISKDSRFLGAFDRKNIIGKVGFRFYPFDKIGTIK